MCNCLFFPQEEIHFRNLSDLAYMVGVFHWIEFGILYIFARQIEHQVSEYSCFVLSSCYPIVGY